MFISIINSEDYSGKPQKPDILSAFHRIICIFGTLITLYYLLMCVFSFNGALDDMRKFGGLGFSYSFSYYLSKNTFPESIGILLPIAAEFLLYLILCRRAKYKKSYRASINYFSIMLFFHAVIWMHANSLNFPEFPPYITAEGVGMDYYVFACIAMLQSIAYFILYLLRVRKLRSGMTA